MGLVELAARMDVEEARDAVHSAQRAVAVTHPDVGFFLEQARAYLEFALSRLEDR